MSPIFLKDLFLKIILECRNGRGMISHATAREGNIGNCHSEKTNFDRVEVEIDIRFQGVTISHVTLSCSQNFYNIDHSQDMPTLNPI